MVHIDLPISFTSVPTATVLSFSEQRLIMGVVLCGLKLEGVRAPSDALFHFSLGLKLVIQKHKSGILTL